MRHRHRQLVQVVAACWMLLVLSACAANQKPDTVIAAAGADVMTAIEQVQTGVIALNKQGALPDATTRTILDGILKSADVGSKLSSELKAYHALTVPDQAALARVSSLVNVLAFELATTFNIELPPGVVSQIQALLTNVDRAILAVKLELAKGVA